jgi:membrane-bound inhibitor of C-type lysozyme
MEQEPDCVPSDLATSTPGPQRYLSISTLWWSRSKTAITYAIEAAHIAVGVDVDGIKQVLGIWVQTSEGARYAPGCALSWPTGASRMC